MSECPHRHCGSRVGFQGWPSWAAPSAVLGQPPVQWPGNRDGEIAPIGRHNCQTPPAQGWPDQIAIGGSEPEKWENLCWKTICTNERMRMFVNLGSNWCNSSGGEANEGERGVGICSALIAGGRGRRRVH